MHTQERQPTRFFVFYNWSAKKTEPTVLFRTETTVFLETEPNLKNPFRTSLPEMFKFGIWNDLGIS